MLVGLVTDSGGLTSTLQAPYRVAAAFDITAPVVSVASPVGTDSQIALITLNGPSSHNLTVSGNITDSSAISSVVVNNVTATLNSSTAG